MHLEISATSYIFVVEFILEVSNFSLLSWSDVSHDEVSGDVLALHIGIELAYADSQALNCTIREGLERP